MSDLIFPVQPWDEPLGVAVGIGVAVGVAVAVGFGASLAGTSVAAGTAVTLVIGTAVIEPGVQVFS